MKKVTLFGHRDDRERILRHLHTAGAMQLRDLKGEDLEIGQAIPEDLKEISDQLLRVSRLVNILKIAPPKMSMLQNILGLETMQKAQFKRQSRKESLTQANAFLKAHEKELIVLEEEHLKYTEALEELREQRQLIFMLHDLGLPISLLFDTEMLAIRAGTIPSINIAPFEKELKKELQGLAHTEEVPHTNKESVLVVSTLKESAMKVNFLMKKFGMVQFALPALPPGKKARAWIDQEFATTKKNLQKTIAEIKKRHKIMDESIHIREELELLKERFEAVHKMRESTGFFLVQGWVPDDRVHEIHSLKEAHIIEDEPASKDEVPVELANPGWLRPFEMLTELYAMPHYRDLDPTFIVGPLFLIFAGFMLTDFVYGLGLVILGSVILSIFKKNSGMRDISISIVGIGFFAMLFGVLTGSYLGDAPKYFLGISTAELAIWKDPLADPLYFLILSLAVGLIHLNIGLILGVVEDVRQGKWKALMTERVVWWLLQITVLAYALGWGTSAHVLLGCTVVLVLILHGPLGLLGMTGFMGDVISYSRLFALALSTAGIAMTVNLLSDMLAGIPYVGFILAAIVFIAGHLFSFLMNALGSFVHSIRLQFVEFFGKFYEGGGDRFAPFQEERVYTEVHE